MPHPRSRTPPAAEPAGPGPLDCLDALGSLDALACFGDDQADDDQGDEAAPTEATELDLRGMPTLTTAARKRHFRHLAEVDNAARVFGELPGPGESTHYLMHGDWNGWDLVPAVLKLAGDRPIRELIVSTLGFNRSNTAEMLRLADAGRVERIDFVCSNYFKASEPDVYRLMAEELAARGGRCLAFAVHSKVIGMHFGDDLSLVVETSANLRTCRKIEQGCMTNDPRLFRWHAAWIRHALELVATGQAREIDRFLSEPGGEG